MQVVLSIFQGVFFNIWSMFLLLFTTPGVRGAGLKCLEVPEVVYLPHVKNVVKNPIL